MGLKREKNAGNKSAPNDKIFDLILKAIAFTSDGVGVRVVIRSVELMI